MIKKVVLGYLLFCVLLAGLINTIDIPVEKELNCNLYNTPNMTVCVAKK